MKIPKSSRRIGNWAAELVEACSADRTERIRTNAIYRNVYLVGDEDGNPQVYPKTFAYVDNLSSYLYSPVELRFLIEPYGPVGMADRAKNRAASAYMHRQLRRANVDTLIEQAVTWSLVKGKTFIKTMWERGSLVPYLIQPELMGVLRPDLCDLDRQEAFAQTAYITPQDFARRVMGHDDEKKLLQRVKTYTDPGKGRDDPEQSNALKEIVLGGLNPYQQAGRNQGQRQKGVVNWLAGPKPVFAPNVKQNLIRIDELWVWDDDRDDWTTIQLAGPDCVLEGGGDTHRNLLADAPGIDPKLRGKDNPLRGHHPFQEFCPNPLDGYFWGLSEILHVGLLQKSMNARIDGINLMLRKQEQPSRVITGSSSINQQAIAKLNKPGGWLAESGPQMKVDTIAMAVPADVWASLHELERLYNDMAGFAPVLQGRGEAGVRSQSHAAELTKNASPRFKDRALLVERQVAGIGGLVLDILKAHVDRKLTAFVAPKDGGVDTIAPPIDPTLQTPVPGQKVIEFMLNQLDDDAMVTVDSHSSSPAFSYEARGLMFDLAKIGAADAEMVVSHVHPPGEDNMITDIQRKQQAQAEMLQAHPEMALKQIRGGKK